MTHTTKHTPGPWVAERDTARNAYAWKVTGAKGVVEDIARLALVDSVSQIEANANLIAAAPAMYEALSQVQAFIQTLVEADVLAYPTKLTDAVKGALAQAEGRQ